MNKKFFIVPAMAMMIAFAGCKSQYTAAYNEANSGTATPKQEVVEEDITNAYLASQTNTSNETENVRSEKYTLVTGDEAMLKHYNVVVGSFGKQENAIRLHQVLQSEYRPLVVMNENGMYRVVISTHDTYQEAKAQISKINATYPDAWVLVRKN
ncbi:MAG: SPOR domain-containing protein [Paludibacteraceae bacterium]|nr:SPOR domain-containing protein [Paludibacteraceae bacterium]